MIEPSTGVPVIDESILSQVREVLGEEQLTPEETEMTIALVLQQLRGNYSFEKMSALKASIAGARAVITSPELAQRGKDLLEAIDNVPMPPIPGGLLPRHGPALRASQDV